MTDDLKPVLARLALGETLSREDASSAFETIMSGGATPAQIGAFLMGLRVRGERIEEIVGAVDVMRARMKRVDAPADAVDIVGTGGDGSGSYNVSTCTAIVAAACGLTVAKHGNRALSSRSGAADTLAALGADIDLAPEGIATCIAKSGLGFMFAPLHHAAMRHVGPARAEMGTRTIFNLLGPLSNPASASRMLLGVFSPNWVEPLAHVTKDLGMRAVWVVHGQGLDEVTTTGPTKVAELKGGAVRSFEITPEEAGLPRAEMSALKGGDAQHNAKALRAVLDGEPGAYRDIVLLNTAAALVVADAAETLADGAQQAAERIDDGSARATLERFVAASQAAAA